MFARSCPRAGVRFAGGNVFYMSRTFSARHLRAVSSPLSTGFIPPANFAGAIVAAAAAAGSSCVPSGVAASPSLSEAAQLEQSGNGLATPLPPASLVIFNRAVVSASECLSCIRNDLMDGRDGPVRRGAFDLAAPPRVARRPPWIATACGAGAPIGEQTILLVGARTDPSSGHRNRVRPQRCG
jgi:hypothetical protein